VVTTLTGVLLRYGGMQRFFVPLEANVLNTLVGTLIVISIITVDVHGRARIGLSSIVAGALIAVLQTGAVTRGSSLLFWIKSVSTEIRLCRAAKYVDKRKEASVFAAGRRSLLGSSRYYCFILSADFAFNIFTDETLISSLSASTCALTLT
jgi:hypothetical protein